MGRLREAARRALMRDGSQTSPCPAVRRRPQSSQERGFEVAGDDAHFAERSAERRCEGEALIREADNLSCQSWNERMCRA
jgi:hypothetical protein